MTFNKELFSLADINDQHQPVRSTTLAMRLENLMHCHNANIPVEWRLVEVTDHFITDLSVWTSFNLIAFLERESFTLRGLNRFQFRAAEEKYYNGNATITINVEFTNVPAFNADEALDKVTEYIQQDTWVPEQSYNPYEASGDYPTVEASSVFKITDKDGREINEDGTPVEGERAA